MILCPDYLILKCNSLCKQVNMTILLIGIILLLLLIPILQSTRIIIQIALAIDG